MPKNLDLIVPRQVVNEIMNVGTIQNFHNTRVLTFVFMEKTKNLQERTFREKTLLYHK